MQKQAYAVRARQLDVEKPQLVPESEEGAELPSGDVFTWPCLPQIRDVLRSYALVLPSSTSVPTDPT